MEKDHIYNMRTTDLFANNQTPPRMPRISERRLAGVE